RRSSRADLPQVGRSSVVTAATDLQPSRAVKLSASRTSIAAVADGEDWSAAVVSGTSSSSGIATQPRSPRRSFGEQASLVSRGAGAAAAAAGSATAAAAAAGAAAAGGRGLGAVLANHLELADADQLAALGERGAGPGAGRVLRDAGLRDEADEHGVVAVARQARRGDAI